MTGRSGVSPIARFDPSGLPTRIAGQVSDFDPGAYVEAKEIKKMDLFTHYAIAAAQQVVDSAQFDLSVYDADQVGVIVGAAIGGIATIEQYHQAFLEGGVKKVSPFFVPRLIGNIAAGQIAIRFGMTGVNYCTTSACASGAHAIGDAFRLIRDGYQTAMIAGGAEAGVTPMTIAGFNAMRALSTRNDDPTGASRPFERERDGFVVAEGAGLILMERCDAALKRNAPILAEIIGYGATADAHHITTPAPEGAGAANCMKAALSDAGVAPEEIGYINAHGTSTPYNDLNETQAIKTVFGEHARKLAVSSTKSMTGHALGAAGGIEAVYTILTLARRMLPPTINLKTPDPECDLDYVANVPRPVPRLTTALSNSFGFGGANASVAFRRWDPREGAV